jgi:hypothetical protein
MIWRIVANPEIANPEITTRCTWKNGAVSDGLHCTITYQEMGEHSTAIMYFIFHNSDSRCGGQAECAELTRAPGARLLLKE